MEVSDINEKVELSYKKMTTYILKPLMFEMRKERFCTTGVYPLSIEQLLVAYDDENQKLVEYFVNTKKFEQDIETDHKGVLMFLHDRVQHFMMSQ